jgi:mRNA interferase MazF
MNQYDVYWVDLNPTLGSEINKIRPAVIISPNEMNAHLNTLIIAPMTSTIKSYPYRVNCSLGEKKASIALDQIRTVDKIRLQSRMGRLSGVNIQNVKSILKEMLVE